MAKNVTMLPGASGEYDPLLYIQKVVEGMEDRYSAPGHSSLLISVVITVDEDGTIRQFSSFADHERMLGLLSLARRYAEDQLAEAYTSGFEDRS